jgi:hypothetical protein
LKTAAVSGASCIGIQARHVVLLPLHQHRPQNRERKIKFRRVCIEKEKKKMRLSTTTLTIVLLGALVAFSLTPGLAQNSNGQARPGTSVVGYISDSMCGLKHMSGMGDDKNCTLACVKGGSQFVLADRDHKKVYKLDKAGQDKAREFAGQKVKVTGRVTGRTIRVTLIEPES